MHLLHGLPSRLETGRLTVGVRTGAAFWIWLSSRLPGLDDRRAMNLLEQAVEDVAKDGRPAAPGLLGREESEAVLERVLWFLRGGADALPEAKSGAPGERLLDYERDLDAVYAAFLQAYGLDLYAPGPDGRALVHSLHWWRFLALADNLPDGTRLTDFLMRYRAMDVTRLPRKSQADRERLREILAVKRRVSLDRPRPGPPGSASPPGFASPPGSENAPPGQAIPGQARPAASSGPFRGEKAYAAKARRLLADLNRAGPDITGHQGRQSCLISKC